MEEIRAFTEEHLRDTANLYLRAMRGQSRPAPPALEDAFRESFLENPWVSPEIASLVYLDKGQLVGFVGVIPRPMKFRGSDIRAATIASWMVDRESHRGLAGMKLLRKALDGPQEFSVTDGAGNEASTVWTALGGRVSLVHSFNWMRILRPFQTARSFLSRATPTLGNAFGLFTLPMDFLSSKVPSAMLRPPKSSCSFKSASTAELFECIQERRFNEALSPVYSMPSFAWLMNQAGTGSGHKGFRTMIVSNSKGALCGWFVYYVNPGAIAHVLQIGSHRKSEFADVLLALFQDAWEHGACAVRGQAIPQFLVTLTEQYCLFRQPYACVIGHSRNPEIINAFQTGDVWLSQLDAEAWLRFSSEDWT